MDTLTADNLKQLHALLQASRERLIEQLEIAKPATGVVTLDQTSVGRISRIDAIQQQSMAVSTLAKAKVSLQKVNAALLRLENDNYGFCNKCDENIELRRLMVQPEASFCLQCQNQLDQT